MSHALAVDLGGTKCSAAVVDGEGKILARRTVPVDLSSKSAPVSQIVELAQELASGEELESAYVGAGAAVPGLVRPDGTVWAPNLPGWEEMPLARHLTQSLGVPVYVESDRNAAVLGESWLGAAQGKSDAIVLMIGTGIGAGILSGGRILRGAHELSGCVGWLTITREHVRSAQVCGELESLAAGPAIARAVQQRMCDGEASSLADLDISKITAHEVAAAARSGDGLAIDVFRHAGRLLGYGIANMVSILDPEIIILGGGMAAVADLYLAPLEQAMFERAQPIAAKKVEIVVSKMADTVNLLGCAHLVFNPAADEVESSASAKRSAQSSRKKNSQSQKEKP